MNFKITIKLIIVFSILLLLQSFLKAQNTSINWINFEQLKQKMEINPKPILIHIYTPWCGFCKKMEQTTFQNAEVIRIINNNYYAINLNGESNKNIQFNGQTYKFNHNYEKRGNGAHELLIKLLYDNIVYPSDIIISPEYKVKKIKRGSSNSENYLELLQSYINSYG